MDKIGLVTITYNSVAVIEPFLNCVFNQTYKNLSLYVIDNASSDGTSDILSRVNDSRLFFVSNPANFGVAKANNQGIRKAIADDCKYVVIINNDVEFESTLIDKLIKCREQKGCSLIAPKMMYFDHPDKIWYAGGFFIKHKGFLPFHRGINEYDRGQFEESILVEYAPTCCLLLSVEVFKDIGFMNEKYFVYFDDTDFLYRIWKDGRHKMYYFPEVSFFHKVGSLTRSFNNKKEMEYRGDFFIQQTTRNHVYFLKNIGGFSSYLFIFWLFFRNNLRFFINPRIQKNLSTWLLINKSYFQGIKM